MRLCVCVCVSVCVCVCRCITDLKYEDVIFEKNRYILQYSRL